MEETDYNKLGFKCGLEIHQQLDTKKLFCNCPSLLRQDNPDSIVKRKLHAVAGESGEVDVAAKHEMSKDKEFIYEVYDTTCLIELDEEPPHEINKEALEIALQISILLKAKIFPLTQIMRKTVVDGSNTSGFQRTVLIARDGYVETKEGKIKIETICLEEDAARIIEKNEKNSVYRLDRLGIPLVEIVTAPEIKSPEQAKEVALHIGDFLRSCKVRRGLGTIRQDVNVSIKKGNRVEVKGVQKPDLIVNTLNFEIERQKTLLDKGNKVSSEVRRALANGETKFLRPMPGAARMYPETDLPLLKISRDLINQAKKSLPKLRSEIAEELRKQKLTEDLIKLILEGQLDNFKALIKIYPKNPLLVAKMLTFWRKEVGSKMNKNFSEVEEKINMDILEKILQEVKKGKMDSNKIKPVFMDLMNGVLLDDAINIEEKDLGNIEEKIMKVIKGKPGLSSNAYMGLVMKEFKGQISGNDAMEIIKKYSNN